MLPTDNQANISSDTLTVLPTEGEFVYPPKYQQQDSGTNIWIKSILSLAIYLVFGFYIFPSYKILLLITIIVIIHELGHFIAMKSFGYKDLGMFFIPLLGAYVSGKKREVSQKESAIILLAGPLPGIIIGILFFYLYQNNPNGAISGIYYYYISLLFVLLNLFNLLPIYPLDGGQLLSRVFFDEDDRLRWLIIFISVALLSWVVWKLKNPVLFAFPALLLLRMFGDNKLTSLEKKVEEAGINTDLEYDELPDKDYWAIRKFVIEEIASFRNVQQAPPFEYSNKEDKIMNTIQSILHRHLIQDISVVGKIFILLIWAASIIAPWLIGMNMNFFNQLGF